MTALTTLSYEESPVFVPAGQETLFGIWTSPVGPASDCAITMLAGAGNLTCTHRNRMYVHLARELAAQGHHVLRIDYHGVGESTGSVQGFALDEPFTSDLAAAVAWVEAQGFSQHVLVGTCFGARTILAGAESIRHLLGVALISPPVRDFERGEETAIEFDRARMIRRLRDPNVLRGLLDADRRRVYRRFVSAKAHDIRRRTVRKNGNAIDPAARSAPGFREPLRSLVDRRVPIFLLYGKGDGLWQHFERAAAGDLADSIRKGTDLIQTELFDGKLHNFDNLEAQRALVEAVTDWAAMIVPGPIR